MNQDISRFDNVPIKRATMTPEGYLRAEAVVTRAGIFQYTNEDGSIRRELRHPDDVFNSISLDSLKMRPVTNGHPKATLVNSTNSKELAIGYTGETVVRDGDFIISSMLITSHDGVEEVKSGRKQELSLGYTVDLVMEPGEFEGQRYDARQSNIKYNHLAIVPRGRAGASARIHLDQQDIKRNVIYQDFDYTIDLQEERLMPTEETSALVDALKLAQQSIMELEAKIKELEGNAVEIDTVTAEKDALQDKLDQANAVDVKALIASAVKERIQLIEAARKLSETNFDEMSDLEVKVAVVKEHCVKVNLDEKSEAYIQARFDTLVEDFADKPQSNISAQRASLVEKADSVSLDAESSRKNMIDRLMNGYKSIKSGDK